MNMMATRDNIFIRKLKKNECPIDSLKSHDSIAPQIGVVVTSGPGWYDRNGVLRKTGVSDGDKVLYSGAQFLSYFICDEDYIIIKPKDVLAVLLKF